MKRKGPPPTTTHRSTKPSKPLTRADVARLLRVSISTVRRTENAGLLHPRVTPNGVHVFDPVEVEQISSTRRRRTEATDNGEVAARILELFRADHSVADVVIATRQPVGFVRRLYRLHCGEGDDLVIPATIRRQIEDLIGRRMTAEDLLRVVERMRSRTNGHGVET